jgi:hypothetical protein
MQDSNSVFAENKVKYRFEPLVSSYFFYITGSMVLFVFWNQILAVITSGIDSIRNFTITFNIALILSVIFIVPLIHTYISRRKCKIEIDSDGIILYNPFVPTRYIGWQEITAIKSNSARFFGISSLFIKTASGNRAGFVPQLYDVAQMLDRTRELAGSEHMLVRALEKELSRPRHALRTYWIWIFGSSGLILSIWLFGGNIYASAQEQPLEQAIVNYTKQHPKMPPNQSAIELQSLMTKLGLSVKEFGDGSQVSVKPEPAKIAEWKEIEPKLNKYLTEQLESIGDSIEPLPSELATYLKIHQSDIDAIETHLVNQPVSQWGMDSNLVAKSNLTSGDTPIPQLMSYDLANIKIQQLITASSENRMFNSSPELDEESTALYRRDKESSILSELRSFDLINIENLLLARVVEKHQLPNTEISRGLEAINKLQQSIQTQSSLVGQLISRIGERKIAGLVQHVDKIPTGWGNSLFGQERYQKMSTAIEGESLNISRVFQSQDLFNQLFIPKSSPLKSIPPYYQLSQPRIRLSAIDRDLRIKQGIAHWQKQNICYATEMDRDMLFSLSFFGRDYDIGSLRKMLYLYPRVALNDLMWEMSSNTRQIKAKLATGQKADVVAQEFNVKSQVCVGERWTATATDGVVTLAFSHPPNHREALLFIDYSNMIKPPYKIKSVEQV